MATSHSSRTRPLGRASDKRSKSPSAPSVPTKQVARSAAGPKPKRKKGPESRDFDEILGHFSDALAFVETAHSALETAQEDGEHIGPAVHTLDHGVRTLRCVYTELDLAIQRQS